jgi:hypothetical protein
VKKPTAFIETMTNPSEATCCEVPCVVAGKPPCVEFDINAPGANAKKKTSSAEFSDASGSGDSSGDSSGSNGSNKHLLAFIIDSLTMLLDSIAPLALLAGCEEEKESSITTSYEGARRRSSASAGQRSCTTVWLCTCGDDTHDDRGAVPHSKYGNAQFQICSDDTGW